MISPRERVCKTRIAGPEPASADRAPRTAQGPRSARKVLEGWSEKSGGTAGEGLEEKEKIVVEISRWS
jgi:hypothetical protein